MPADHELHPGDRLGPYEIGARLGKGGMGEIWRAHDPRLGRNVAIKLLPAELARDPERLARFEREARALAALNHPSIVTIHSVEEAGETRFLTMELVEGQPLRPLIPAGGLPLERVLDIAIALADALVAAHARGILHRDLKPDNVMVTPEGLIKVLDFGLAKLVEQTAGASSHGLTATVDELTRDGEVVGTVPYMSPEQLQGRPIDARSDLFSLGIVLYEMTTGQRPFRGASVLELASSVLRDEPISATDLRPDLPPALGRVIRRCLAKDPEQRVQSAKDLRNDLQDLQAEIARSTGVPAAGRRTPQARGRLRRAAAAAGAIVTVALLASIAWLAGRNAGPDPQEIRSIAVLPLDNLSGDPREDYFADGMTDALIADLARIEALRVTSRTSVMQYKGARRALPAIARELGVDALIEGSVVRAGDRVRIRARLVHAPSERHLWTNSYERELRDIIALQNDVAAAIVRELRVQMTPADQQRFADASPVDPVAHELYLRGLHAWNQRTTESIERAIRLFDQALERDARYAPAHAGLASAYVLRGYFDEEPSEAVSQGIAAARAALALDDTIASAHAALGLALAHYDRDLPAAERAFRLAIERSPSDAQARFWYAAHYLAAVGAFDAAIEQVERGWQLDPVSPIINAGVSWVHYMARDWEASAEYATRTLVLAPDYPIGLERSSTVLRHMGQHEAAIETAQRYVDVTAGSPRARAELAAAYAVAGRTTESRSLLAELQHEARRRYISAVSLARVCALLGAADASLAWLEKAADERAWGVIHLAVDPDFDNIRTDPRFERLLTRLGVPLISSTER